MKIKVPFLVIERGRCRAIFTWQGHIYRMTQLIIAPRREVCKKVAEADERLTH